MKRKQLGNLTAYQLHEIRRGRLDVRLPTYLDGRPAGSTSLLHSVEVEGISSGAVWVHYYRSSRGSHVEQARVTLDTMVEVG